MVVSSEGQGRYRVWVDDSELLLTVETLGDGRLRLITHKGAVLAEVTVAGPRRFVRLNGTDFALERIIGARKRKANADAGSLEAPMPGIVTRVMTAVGDVVHKGQPLIAVEAMKMEHLVRAPREGTIKQLLVRAGELVQGGATLIELEQPENVP